MRAFILATVMVVNIVIKQRISSFFFFNRNTGESTAADISIKFNQKIFFIYIADDT